MVVHEDRPGLAKTEATRAFEPRDIGEAFEMARLLVASGFMPRGVQRPEAAFAIIAAGRELGLTAMQSLRSIHIIEGKPTLSADLIAALCKSRSDVCQYFRLVESTDKVARYETHRRGEPAPTAMAFSWEDAQRAGVTGKDNWKKYPAAMLRARCITALARAVYPDLAMGIYDPDEVTPEPVPRGPARVLHQEPTPAPKSEPKANGRAFQGLCDRVDEAETVTTLNAIARDVSRAHKVGAITAEELESLKNAVVRKRGLIGAAPAPKSQPRDVGPAADENDAAEIEGDVMAGRFDE
jgi:hypothetical protein